MITATNSIMSCDNCDAKRVSGYLYFSRGATGRVCCVLEMCTKCQSPKESDISSIDEVKAWAESIPSGYLDF
jgi:hypothetical protein